MRPLADEIFNHTNTTIGTIAFATVSLMYTMLDMIQDLDSANYLISCLVHIQRVDFEYSTLDFSDASKTLTYFRELCSSFTDVPQSMMDDFFGDIVRVISTPGEEKEAAHQIMKEHCDKVHDVLKQSRGQAAWDTAAKVVLLLDQAIIELVGLVGGDYISDKSGRNTRILEEKSKDVASKSHDSDYEVIG